MKIIKKIIKINKKNKIYVIAAALIVLILLGVGVKKYYDSRKQAVPQEVNYADQVKIADTVYKISQLMPKDEKERSILNNLTDSYSAWKGYVETFKDHQPEQYKKTKDWPKKLYQILEYMRKAEELSKENDPESALQQQAAAQEIFQKIKEENGELVLNADLLLFYDDARKIAIADWKDVKTMLPDLKYQFTVLKGYRRDENYQRLILNLEDILGRMDRYLDGSDFRAAQSELLPAFLELYKRY